MFITLTQRKHNRPAVVNTDQIIWIDDISEAGANLYLTNGAALQVSETAAQIADMVTTTITVDEIQPITVEWSNVADNAATELATNDQQAAEQAAAAHAAAQAKPGSKRETK